MPTLARQQVGDGGEFFAGAALSRPGDFGRLDLLPVAEGDDVDAAAFEKRVEPGPPFLAAGLVAQIRLDPFGHLIAVGPVGANRAGQIGGASCRERVWQVVSILVVAVYLKKKNKKQQ